MRRKVRVTKLPEYGQGDQVRMGGNDVPPPAYGFPVDPAEHSVPDLNVSNFVGPVPRDKANIEAEKGETMITPMGDDAQTRTLPKTFVIGGKRHYKGGTPLNVPDGTFVYSDHLKETNQDVHALFGKKPKKSGYTYAELSKPYMINNDLKRLISEYSDKISQKTAKMNIQNKLDKLSLLALLQESKKGFGEGEDFDVPDVGLIHLQKTDMNLADAIQPYIDAINPMPKQQQTAKYGGPMKMKKGGNVRGLKPGHRVDRDTGEIIDQNGKVVGYVTTAGPTDAKPTKKASIPKDATVIRRKDYSTEEEYIAARNKAFNESQGKTIYTQDSKGTYRKVSTRPMKFEPYQGELFDKVFNKNQAVADQYYYIQQKFNTPAAKKALQEKAIAAYKNSDNVRGMSKAQVDAAVKRLENNPELAYEQFMEMQKRNLSLAANEYSVAGFQNAPDSSGISNKDFDDAYKAIGLDALTKEDAALQQAIYIGYRDLLTDRDNGKLDAELASDLKYFTINQIGQSDDAIEGERPGSISKIDGIYTNTTAGEVAGIRSSPEIFEADLEGEKNKDVDSSTIDPATSRIVSPWSPPHVKRLLTAQRNLTSDVVEQPWNKVPDYYFPNVYLDSPDQQAFQLRGKLNAYERMLGTYAGGVGQFASAASAQTGASDISAYIAQVGRENKERVNRHEYQLADIMNKAATERAGIATRTHEQGVLAREKGRAFKREAMKQWDDAYDFGWNKATELGMLNARSPQYNINPWANPWVAGAVEFDRGKPLVEEDPDAVQNIMDKLAYYKEIYPDIEEGVILQAIKADKGLMDPYPSYLNYGSSASLQ